MTDGPSWRQRRRRAHKPVEGGGLSSPVGGISRPKRLKSQKEHLEDVVSQLGKHSALYRAYDAEGESYVNHSIIELRDRLDQWLLLFDKGTPARVHLETFRDRCSDYLRAAPEPQGYQPLRPEFAAALKGLREHVRISLLTLASEYNLPEAKTFADRIEHGTNW